MLELIRKYQKFFFFVVTFFVIASFTFFGTFETFTGEEKREDFVVAKDLTGSSLYFSEFEALSRFISSDAEDYFFHQNPNFCNDGVLRRDFLSVGIGELVAEKYFDLLKEEFSLKLEKAKKFSLYAHPMMPLIGASFVYSRYFPEIHSEMIWMKENKDVNSELFSHLCHLYLQQSKIPPEALRSYLKMRMNQMKEVNFDPRIDTADLSLLGFHTAADWFGKKFIDFVSLFIFNAAAQAEKKGFFVSLEEARGDLLRNFQIAKKRLEKGGVKADFSFDGHLRSLGFTEKQAEKVWQKVLLFRRYFQGLSEATFIDRLVYKDFASYALKTAVVDRYSWDEALKIKNFSDLIQLETYLLAVGKEREDFFPQAFKTFEEIQKEYPELIQTHYKVNFVEASSKEALLKSAVKEVWAWEMEDQNWKSLKNKFSYLPNVKAKEERFHALEILELAKRAEIDLFARKELLKSHPERVESLLKTKTPSEVPVYVSKKGISIRSIQDISKFSLLLEKASLKDSKAMETLLNYSEDGETFFSIQQVEKEKEAHLLTFKEAKKQGLLSEISDRLLKKHFLKLQKNNPEKFQGKSFEESKEEVALLFFKKEEQPFKKTQVLTSENVTDFARERLAKATDNAREDIQKTSEKSPWLVKGDNPLMDQFRMHKTEKHIQRKDKVNWMNEEGFVMLPNDWSPVHMAEDGEISFFYVKESKDAKAPILEQLHFGKQIIAEDAKRYLAEKLLRSADENKSVLFPSQNKL